MRSTFLLFVPLLAITSLACGSPVDPSTTGTTGSGGSGGAITSSTSSGSGGGSATTSSGSVTGGGTACAGFIDVTEEGGSPQHFASICQGSWGSNETMTAVGYHASGGLDVIGINGCAGPGDKASGVHLTTPKASAPGTFTAGTASYTDGSGVGWGGMIGDPYKMVITKLDGPGGVIEGTFTATVTGPTDGKKSLTGSFHVCRVMDDSAP